MCFYTAKCRQGFFRRVNVWDTRSAFIVVPSTEVHSIVSSGRRPTPVRHNVNLNLYGRTSRARQPFCLRRRRGQRARVSNVPRAPILNLTVVDYFSSVIITRPVFKCKRKKILPSVDVLRTTRA